MINRRDFDGQHSICCNLCAFGGTDQIINLPLHVSFGQYTSGRLSHAVRVFLTLSIRPFLKGGGTLCPELQNVTDETDISV